MALAHSKVTAQGQISVPMEVRRKLGIGPGSVLEWDEEGNTVVVTQGRPVYVGRHSSSNIPKATPASREVKEFDKGVRRYMKKKDARR